MIDDRYKAAPYGLWISPDGQIHYVYETNGHYNSLKGLGLSENQISQALALGWIRGVFIKDDKSLEYEHSSKKLPSDFQMRKVKHAAQDNGMEFLDNVTLSKRIGVYEKDELLSLYLHNVLNEYKVKMPTWADRYGDQ